jgi:hypothetical protein
MKIRLGKHRIREYSIYGLSALAGFLVATAINLLSTWVTNRYGQTPSQLLQVTIFIIGIAFFIWLLTLALNQPKKSWVLVPDDQQPKPCAGIILLVGPGRPGQQDPLEEGPYTRAIEFHLKDGNLKACWLVHSQEATYVALALKGKYQGKCIMILREVPHAFQVQDTYNIVRQIYQKEVPANAIEPTQVIADFTQGTRPMTAGMALACGTEQRMQYMTRRSDGSAEPTPLEVKFTSEFRMKEEME